MNICLISRFPPSRCGVAEYTKNLVQGLKSLKINVLVICEEHCDASEKVGVSSVAVGKFARLSSFFQIFKQLLKVNVDVIHIQFEKGIYGYAGETIILLLLFSKILMKPIVVTIHSTEILKFGEDSSTYQTFNKYLRILVQWFIYRVFSLTCSTFVFHNELRHLPPILRRKAFKMEHGISLPEKEIDNAKRELQFDHRKIIVFFGFIRPDKGIEYAIKAMPYVLKQIPNFSFLICGDIRIPTKQNLEYRQMLRKLVHDFNLSENIQFKRYLTPQEIARFMSMADVVIFPYVKNDIVNTSGPLCLAMSYRKAIIATDIPIFEEVKKRKIGLVIRPRDSKALGNSIIRLLNDERLRLQCEHAAYLCSVNASWKVIAQKTSEMYHSLIDK